MAKDLSTMRAPVTRANWPTDKTPTYITLVGNVAKPTSLTSTGVYPIPLVMTDQEDIDLDRFSKLQEVEEFWQLQIRSNSALTDCQITLWAWNVWVEEWHPWKPINYKGDLSNGGIWTDNGILGSSHIGFQVDGHSGLELYITHMWS
jgi:hypothetical protein